MPLCLHDVLQRSTGKRRTVLPSAVILGVSAAMWTSWLHGESIQYTRPVQAAPAPNDIGGGYVLPAVQRPASRSDRLRLLDVGLMTAGMGAVGWLALRRRSRRGIVLLTILSLVYFGFYRKGCVCPVGAIQNVAVALTDAHYAVGYVVILTFFLPLVLAILFGRVFCGGVCPLGGIQELILLKSVRVPTRVDRWLGLLRYAYLLLALVWAVRPAEVRDFIICRFDPFVGLFRRTGSVEMLLVGGAILILAMFVGRPYCRYLCPYGALLSIVSRFAWRGVTITPARELDCGLCTDACPYGAIEGMRAIRSACLSCARCFDACPVERAAQEGKVVEEDNPARPA